MSETAFAKLWGMWPDTGKRRTQGLKANSKRKDPVTPMERCRKALSAVPVAHDVVIKCAEQYIAATDPQYVMGLERWLEEGRWQNEEAAATGHADMLEPVAEPGGVWRKASGEVLKMLAAMSEVGCPDDVLDKLFSGGIGVTRVNADRGMPPTAVARDHFVENVWDRACSGYAEKAGYNRVTYTKDYVEHVRWKKANGVGCFSSPAKDITEPKPPPHEAFVEQAVNEALENTR